MLLVAGLISAVELPGQEKASAGASSEVITTAVAFWELSNEEKQKPHRISFELVIYYYDPVWQLVWGELGGEGSFLPVRGEPLPIKCGQRVRIEGVVTPARGILRDEVTVTVLQENVLPAPLATKGQLGDWPRLDARWATLEGLVCQQRMVDPTHVEYLILADDRLISTRVLVDPADAIPNAENSWVRTNGVYVSSRDSVGALQRVDFWVPRPTDFTVLQPISDDPRFRLPRTPIDRLPMVEGEDWILVSGTVHQFESGRSLTVRDQAGQLQITTPQVGSLQAGDGVEVVGCPSGVGLDRTITGAIFRQLPQKTRLASSVGDERRPPSILRIVDQIMELPPGEVARGYPVILRGVVTCTNPVEKFFYLQDATGGVCVRFDETVNAPILGESTEIDGVTELGPYAPEVRLRERKPLAGIARPTARQVTLEQALTGAEEGRWVAIQGYLRRVETGKGWTRMDVTTSAGEFVALTPPDASLAELVGANVSMKGVCAAETDGRKQLTGIRLWVPERAAVQVLEPPPTDLFAAPALSIASLRQYHTSRSSGQWVRLAGVVLHHEPGRYLILQEGDFGLMVLSRETQSRKPGETIEVAGFPGRQGSRMVLRESFSRPAKAGPPVAPLKLEQADVVKPELDTRLVRVSASLRQAVVEGDVVRLSVQADGVIFEAALSPARPDTLPAPGSLLELTGVYLLEFDEYRRPRAFGLQLRTAGDVVVVAAAPWWTMQRALVAAIGLAVCVMLGTIWVTSLRRRVREQTAQIRRQLAKEARMQSELENSSRLESLGVLAGGIAHDFNNLLTAILGNLGLAILDVRPSERMADNLRDAERAALRARDITQQLLTFAKGGDPVRDIVSLPELVSEAAGFARHGSNVRVEFDFGQNLPAADADAGQIGRVVHNLVLNAVQAMTGGGVLRISLAAVELWEGEVAALPAGRYLRLVFADNGPGIAPENLPHIFDPYFSTKTKNNGLGLATVHSIIKKHHGHIVVESEIGRGTTFVLWIQAAAAAVEQTASTALPATPTVPARVLFMDDEDGIRKFAGSVFKRFGYDATLVPDGGAAVKAYAAASAAGTPFDVVVLDLTVPGGMGGKDAIAALRQSHPKVRAIASSGYSSDPVMANFRSYGFQAIVPKPYDVKSLLRTINEVHAG